MGNKRANPQAMYWAGVQHCRVRHEVLNSPAWRVLGFPAKALYMDLRARLNSTNNGNINAVFSELKHRGWSSSATLSRALKQLERMGFIAKTRQGGIAALSKVCTLYRFTDLPVLEHPKQGVPEIKETHDYRKFESVREAQKAIEGKLSEVNLQTSRNEPITPVIDSPSEQEAYSQLHYLKQSDSGQSRAIVGDAAK